MRALQQAALPEIKAMLQLNPLSSYAAWSPRQIAGSNPAYEQLFQQANNMGPALNGLSYLFGGGAAPQTAEGGNGLTVPYMGGYDSTGTYTGGTTPAPPPQFQPQNIQDIVNYQVQQAVAPAVQQAVNQASPPRNSIQVGPNSTTYYDMYGNPHDLLGQFGATSAEIMDQRNGHYGDPYIQTNAGGIPIAQYFPV